MPTFWQCIENMENEASYHVAVTGEAYHINIGYGGFVVVDEINHIIKIWLYTHADIGLYPPNRILAYTAKIS